MYQADPNNNNKMIPKGRPKSAYGKATTPSAQIISDRPNYIIINKTGTYRFAYESGSLESYESGSVITADGPVRLDINPVAWETVPAGGTKGAVTFVYTGDVV